MEDTQEAGEASEDENNPENETRLMLEASKDEVVEWRSLHLISKSNLTKHEEGQQKKYKKKRKRLKKLLANDKYGYLALYRFATPCQKVMMLIGVLCAIASGLCVPIMVKFFGELTNTMVAIDLISQERLYLEHGGTMEGLHCFTPEANFTHITNIEDFTHIKQGVKKVIKWFTIWHSVVAFIFMVLSCLYFICWCVPAEKMIKKMRKEYFKALLRKDTNWYDMHSDVDFGSQLLEHTQHIRDGIGQGIPTAIDLIFMFLFSCGNAFYHGWSLSLIAFISIPIFIVSSSMVALADASRTIADEKAFSQPLSLAEEVISNIRTVMIYNAQRNELRRFKHELNTSSKKLFRRCLCTAVCNGIVWFLSYANYALTCWFGATWVLYDRDCTDHERSDKYDAGDLIVIFFSIMFGAINVGLALPTWEAVRVAKSHGKEILELIDNKTEIDSLSEEGLTKVERAKGAYHFENIKFFYYSRPESPILNGFTATIDAGTTVAFVGPSGCGKSTVLRLIMKEYLVESGSMQMDGVEMKDWNTKWLRSQIGVVTHTPSLFNMTIEENVRLGKPNATSEEVRLACTRANAHGFISELQDRYQTVVGVHGGKLSLGEKQRISIARALIKNPPILILDAPTSALDVESEEIVQETLEEASRDRTTFIVAHRLANIVKADRIFVLDKGQVVENGSYTELMKMNGIFFKMVSKQANEKPAVIKTNLLHPTKSTTSTVEGDRAKKKASQLSQEIVKQARTAIPSRSVRAYRANKMTTNVFLPQNLSSETKTPKNKIQLAENEDIEKYAEGDTAARDHEPEPLQEKEKEQGKVKRETRKATITHSHDSIDIDWEDKRRIEEAHLISRGKRKPTEIDMKQISFRDALCFSSKPSRCLICVGTVVSIIMGATLPIYGVIFGEIIAVFSMIDKDEAKEEIDLLAFAFVMVGCIATVATFIQGLTLSVASYRTVRKIRKILFVSILRQEMAWFEHPENSLSALSNRLSSDAANIEGIILSIYGTFVQCGTTVVVSIFLCFWESITLTLYIIGLVPLVILFTLVDGLLSKIHEDRQAASNEELLNVITETFQNRETVMALQLEEYYIEKFEQCLHRSTRSLWPLTIGRTIAYGLAQAGGFVTYSVCIYASGSVVDQEELTYDRILKVGDAAIFGLFTIGSQLAVIPSLMHAVKSARLIIKIVKRTPLIKYDVGGKDLATCTGEMKFKDVEFSYPMEPNLKVLQSLNLSLEGNGKLYAIVGQSGSGKSTILSLIMRFHEADKGIVEFSGHDIKTLNCSSVRRLIALVEQEPRLFDRTIADNISFGSETRHVHMDEVVEAAKGASIHDFIMTLPDKYKTHVGAGGERLSDGQRHGIAIARALYTRAPIILLDSATCDMDPESEQQFDESIEYARIGKTLVTIPERLATVQHADKIFVISHGKTVEEGNHQELMNLDGMYAKLYKQQRTK